MSLDVEGRAMSGAAKQTAPAKAPGADAAPNLMTAEQMAKWQGFPVLWMPTPAGAWRGRFVPPITSVALLDTGAIGTRLQVLGRTSDLDLKAGALALFGAGTEVRVAQTGSANARRIVVELDPSAKANSSLFDDDLLQGPLTQEVQFQDEPLASVFRAMLREILDGCPNGPLFAQSLSLGVALHLHKTRGVREMSAARERGKLSDDQWARVNDVIEECLANDLTLPALAGALGLSRAQFVRLFRNSAGTSPHRYVMQKRVERARALLLSSDLSLAEIAADAGFASQSHLNRMFRQAFGVTPGDARRQSGRKSYRED